MEFDTTKPLQIVIIGGSTAGLIHGLMAKRLGHNVCILEQYPSDVRDGQAAGISSIAETKEFFDQHERCQRSWYVPATKMTVRDRNFRIRLERKMLFNMTSWTMLYHRLRANFDGLKSDFEPNPPSADPNDGHAEYITGAQAENVQEESNSVSVHYKTINDNTMHSLQADLVIAADGSNSTVRQLLLPDVQHFRHDFLTWRAVVPESAVSPETVKAFENRSNFFTVERSYIIVYLILGENGNIQPGKRTLNFVWYWLCSPSSFEFQEIMTDVDGRTHYGTLPPGRMRPEIWQRQHAKGAPLVKDAPAIKELLDQIDLPFVTAVSDGETPHAVLGDRRRILLVGDALCLLRPHVARSTNQAAQQCLALEKVLRGQLDLDGWEHEVLQYAHVTRCLSAALGDWFLKGWVGYLATELRYRLALLGSVFGFIW